MNIQFIKLIEASSSLVDVFNRWENDPTLIPLTRPSKNKLEMERQVKMSLEELTQRLENHHTYLIYLDEQLVGEMNYMVDPSHLYKKEAGTAWLGITIGEPEGRGKGVGFVALQYLENQIKQQGLNRIELGVFEFNKQAQKLYQKLGYKEIGKIDDFTYWQDKMWSDIRMEKDLKNN
ncbi:RimJ/RimL family protein N-acetyltransferase [Bacillus pakistanensis]|uniref:RimJ/RimL family protein N-acetyltransferase n=1 Tax=Rossellomorea pakistanensis TaxID=992288 RepID=A0ABS2NE76_9BACI|nr:GNAT family N-acetyltransferase [Bacillus pakistanensis]MBM7586054.1 RimJ/RimL family protein N-acetyltransferase [Bacillus pakistanensis]